MSQSHTSQSQTTASFGYWVRRQRMALDLTQADLARAVGCATVTISKIERDERRPSRQMAELLAQHLAVPAEEQDRFVAAALGERATERMPLPNQPLSMDDATPGDVPPTNLPTPTTPFVGRQAEVDELFARLENPDCRLLTLAGPGGFGKTRLGIRLGELALQRLDLFPDGVFFVALDALENIELVVPAVASALGFAFYEQEDLTEQLAAYLVRRRLLLILDNAEEVLDVAWLAALVERTPTVTFLVTSRDVLNLQQEWFHPVAGMAINGHGEGTPASERIGADAAQLFVQSARRVRPDFDLERDADHVIRICRLVDGAPLAVELAAAWLRAVSCARIAAELEQSLDILKTTAHDIPARHRNIQAVLEHSWRRLSSTERQVFNELTVFAGGFYADAAEEVTSVSLWNLAALVEQSMLQVDDKWRYRIHALLAQLGRSKLSAQPEVRAALHARHSAYYIAFLGARRRTMVGRAQARVMDEIAREMDNIRAAWQHAVAARKIVDMASALPVLSRFFWVKGRYSEGASLFEDARIKLDQTRSAGAADALWVALSAWRAQFLTALGHDDEATSILARAIKVAEALEDRSGLARCHCAAGIAAEARWDLVRAIFHLEAADTIYRELEDNLGIAETAYRLGHVRSSAGSHAKAKLLVEEAMRRYSSEDDLCSVAEALDALGVTNLKLGEYDEAKRHYMASLRLAEEIGYELVAAKSIGGLGVIADRVGNREQATQLLEERLIRTESLGHTLEAQVSVDTLCTSRVRNGQYREAYALLEHYPAIAETFSMAEAYVGLGLYDKAWAILVDNPPEEVLETYRPTRESILIGWAMLFAGDCRLVRIDRLTGDFEPLSRARRLSLAAELLDFVSHCKKFPAYVRSRGDEMHARLFAGVPVETIEKGRRAKPRPISEIAQDLAEIRLR
ncbi:MAG: tetratricopeptide repeat protein [Caldilineaceae bacterium]|nr:tetratricopeptide repeat protein [Caldilineaceae bacterium]